MPGTEPNPGRVMGSGGLLCKRLGFEKGEIMPHFTQQRLGLLRQLGYKKLLNGHAEK